MALTTPQAVMTRAGIAAHPEYEDVSPMTDSAGFYTYRRYPPGTSLAHIVTADGRPAVRCYLALIINPRDSGQQISRIELKAWFARRWRDGRVFASRGELDESPPGHPDAPSTASRVILTQSRLPLDLDSMDSPKAYLYDSREDAFLDEDGHAVTPLEMLEEMYSKHCRTLRLGFRIRWNLGTAARWTIRQTVWKGQDGAMWILLNFYDIELIEEKHSEWRNPFHTYKATEFRRTTEKEGERSHFFGFQTSQKSLFTNLTVVVIACAALYYNAPHQGLLRAVYNNTALTTAALVFGFLLADKVGSWLLIQTICWLSRFRDAFLFFVRKVNV